MTPYEIKSHKNALKTVKELIKDSERIRQNAEEQLVSEARIPSISNSRDYMNALINKIGQETTCIKAFEKQYEEVLNKLNQKA